MGFGCNQRAVPLKDAGSSKSELEVSRSRRPPPQEPWISITVTWFVSCQGVRISDITGEDRPASARQHRQPQLGFQMAGMPPAARIHRCNCRARRTHGQSSPLRNQPLAACRWSRRGVAALRTGCLSRLHESNRPGVVSQHLAGRVRRAVSARQSPFAVGSSISLKPDRRCRRVFCCTK
jgi:hypothetical protein